MSVKATSGSGRTPLMALLAMPRPVRDDDSPIPTIASEYVNGESLVHATACTNDSLHFL